MFDNFRCPFNMKVLLHLSNYKDSLIGVGVVTRLPLLIQLFAFLWDQERQRLIEDNERLAALVDNAELDVRHVTELLDKSDKERKRLSDRNAQLTVNGMSHVQWPRGCFFTENRASFDVFAFCSHSNEQMSDYKH